MKRKLSNVKDVVEECLTSLTVHWEPSMAHCCKKVRNQIPLNRFKLIWIQFFKNFDDFKHFFDIFMRIFTPIWWICPIFDWISTFYGIIHEFWWFSAFFRHLNKSFEDFYYNFDEFAQFLTEFRHFYGILMIFSIFSTLKWEIWGFLLQLWWICPVFVEFFMKFWRYSTFPREFLPKF